MDGKLNDFSAQEWFVNAKNLNVSAIGQGLPAAAKVIRLVHSYLKKKEVFNRKPIIKSSPFNVASIKCTFLGLEK